MLIWVKWKQVKKILHDKTYTRRENENVDFFFPFRSPPVDETKCESDDAIDFHIQSPIK